MEAPDHVKMIADPSQPLGMGENRDIAPRQNPKRKVLQPGRGDMMRRFEEEVPASTQGGDGPRCETGGQVRGEMNVSADPQAKGNLGILQGRSQPTHPPFNVGTRVVIDPSNNMGRAGSYLDSIAYSDPSHRQRFLQVCCPVVDAGQNMTMEVDQEILRESAVARSAVIPIDRLKLLNVDPDSEVTQLAEVDNAPVDQHL